MRNSFQRLRVKTAIGRFLDVPLLSRLVGGRPTATM